MILTTKKQTGIKFRTFTNGAAGANRLNEPGSSLPRLNFHCATGQQLICTIDIEGAALQVASASIGGGGRFLSGVNA
jgi:hypothetical protein